MATRRESKKVCNVLKVDFEGARKRRDSEASKYEGIIQRFFRAPKGYLDPRQEAVVLRMLKDAGDPNLSSDDLEGTGFGLDLEGLALAIDTARKVARGYTRRCSTEVLTWLIVSFYLNPDTGNFDSDSSEKSGSKGRRSGAR